MSDDHNIRSTRSSSNHEEQGSEKFDFNAEHEINPDIPLKLVTSRTALKYKGDNADSERVGACDAKDAMNKMILKIENHHIKPKKYESKKKQKQEDLLSDSLYIPYHKKMLKQENRMIEKDIQESEESADNLTLLYDKLNMSTWPITLQKITKINDPNNENEMILKKALTIDKLNHMLQKYKLMKKQASVLHKRNKTFLINPFVNWSEVYKHVDRRFILNYDSCSDEEEENLSIQEIKDRRKRKRDEMCGGTITISLGMQQMASKLAIVAEPLRKPYIIKLSKMEKKKMKKLNIEQRVFKNGKNNRNKIAQLKQKISIPLTLKISDEDKGLTSQEKSEGEMNNMMISSIETSRGHMLEQKVEILGVTNPKSVSSYDNKISAVEIPVQSIRKKKKLNPNTAI